MAKELSAMLVAIALSISSGLVSASAHAASPDDAVAAFVARINATVAPIKPGDRTAIRKACAALIAEAFDFPTMGAMIAGEAWGRMNQQQHSAYIEGLSRRAISDCASHGNEMAGNLLDLVGTRPGPNGDAMVAVKQSKGRGRTIIWQVRADTGGALKAVDMTVDGKSLATDARRDAKAVLKKTGGDVTALVRSVGG